MSRVVPRVLTRLVDDAALFPPGNAPMSRAVPAHDAHAGAWYADVVGPFLCPDTRLPELVAALAARPPGVGPLSVGVIVTRGPDGLAEALAAVADEPGLALAALDVPLPTGASAAAARHAVDAAAAMVPEGVPVFVEGPRDGAVAEVLDVLAVSGHHAKLRTGGTVAEAFPSEAEVAAFVRACLDRGVAFKCTAGLHRALRHTAPDTGFEHHGFANVLLAVHTGVGGGTPAELGAVLAERDEQAVVGALRALDPRAVDATRTWFRSYGTCSVDEPVDDAVRLGLLAQTRS